MYIIYILCNTLRELPELHNYETVLFSTNNTSTFAVASSIVNIRVL